MTCAYLAFTSKGLALARSLRRPSLVMWARSGENGVTLRQWTAAQFAQSDAIVLWGLSALPCEPSRPHCRSKATDPRRCSAG